MKARHTPQRSCIGCRAVREKRDLVRLVHTPEGAFRLDPTGKLAGRGAYLCPAAACLGLAVRRKSFERAFRQSVPREVIAGLESEFEEYVRARASLPPVEDRAEEGAGQA